MNQIKYFTFETQEAGMKHNLVALYNEMYVTEEKVREYIDNNVRNELFIVITQKQFDCIFSILSNKL